MNMSMMRIYTILIPILFFFQIAHADNFPADSISGIPNDTLRVIGVGDIMMGTNFPSEKYLHPKGCHAFFKEVGEVLQNADLTTGNLEGCLSDSAELVKRCKDTTHCYAFRMPLKYAQCLKDNGFDLLSIANNHAFDFGIEGVAHTTKILDSMDIGYAGSEKHPYDIVSSEGITYGFCAFSPNKGTIGITDLRRAAQIVQYLDDTADIVIVSFHGGAEGKDHQRVTKATEYYFGENRGNVYEFAHHVIDAGADIVFGHGPHVTRALELYKDRLICYSLGNFLTYGRFNLQGPNGIAPVIRAHLGADGQFYMGEIIPVKQYYSGNLIIDPQKQVVKEIIKLTMMDFPNSELTITEDGLILKKE
jgi:poly-gamma-glutamate capsule biosynthesis protein CapA/YwtB (metallophosphatase superfamily)